MSKTIKLHFIENFSEGATQNQFEAINKIFELTSPEECDVIFLGSVAKLSSALELKKQFPDKPMVTYCWDYYKWAHEGKNRSYSWGKYADFLKECALVLVPSDGQKLRLKELLGIDAVVCECSIDFYDHKYKVMDKGYVLDPVRDYPEENLGWVQRACEELGIHYIHSEHGFTEEQFRKLVDECTFMTCGYREASTGGLSLMEGLYNGKISLVSNSPYMGAKNYLKDFGFYFQYDDFKDLKEKIKDLWDNRYKLSLRQVRGHCAYFTHEAFADRLYKNILCVLNKNY